MSTSQVPGENLSSTPPQEEASAEQDARDALEMLGRGYDHPSIEIEQRREVVERRNGKLIEAERPAFVKIYTNFKDEMRDIDEIALKVWLYIALSVNRFTDEAHPGLRKIAEDTSFAVNTVRAAIKRLENQYNLLVVEKGNRKYNRYFPVDYVSARRNETVSPDDTDEETVSDDPETVSPKSKTVSARVILNQRNQRGKPEREDPTLDFEEMTVAEAKKVETLNTYWRATGFWPGSRVWKYIHERMTESGITEEKIRAASTVWAARGHRQENAEGILDWAINGIPANGHSPVPSKPEKDIYDEPWRKEKWREATVR